LLEPLVRNQNINAIQTIDYSKIDTWDQEAKKLNGGKGVDFVIEIGGRGTIGRSIRSTKPGGLIAVSGYVSTFKSIDDAVLKEGQSPHHPYGSGTDDRPGPDHSLLCSERPRSLRLQQRRLQNNGISPRDWWCEANCRQDLCVHRIERSISVHDGWKALWKGLCISIMHGSMTCGVGTRMFHSTYLSTNVKTRPFTLHFTFNTHTSYYMQWLNHQSNRYTSTLGSSLQYQA
jgi:hypothetical protein